MKEKLYIYALILVLIISLFGMQSMFINDIENRAIVNNNIDGFIEYRVDNIDSDIQIPKEWTVTQYNNETTLLEFTSKNNINGKLEIIESEKTIQDELDNINYKETSYVLNNSWNVIVCKDIGGAKYYYIKEYSKGKLLKITFKIENQQYKPSLIVVFDKIAESLK